jgi:hypothetical protein
MQTSEENKDKGGPKQALWKPTIDSGTGLGADGNQGFVNRKGLTLKLWD